jgi:DNA-binding transcriptional LysR family regulator
VTVVRQAGTSKVQELRIGIIDSFASTVGPSLIRSLLEQVERLSFRSGLAHDQAEGLLSRNLDLIISSDGMDDVDGLDRYRILTEPFVLLLPAKLAAANPRPDLKALAAGHSLIRFSARSQIGAQIERHLRRLGVKAPRLLEVDATDALMAMVGAGLGWAIATPLCLLQARSQIASIRVVPFPATGFVRQLHLFARAGEYGELPQRVAQLSCDILKRDCAPELRKLVPWLRGQFAIG